MKCTRLEIEPAIHFPAINLFVDMQFPRFLVSKQRYV